MNTLSNTLRKCVCTLRSGMAKPQVLAHYHLGRRINSVWGEDYIAPVPDKEYYFDSSADSDDLNTVNVQAAPTRYFYSIFHDSVLEKFEAQLLKKGRRDLAYSITSNTMRQIKLIQLAKYHTASSVEKESMETSPLVIFHQAIVNTTPAMGLQSISKGGATFQVPIPLSERKKFFMTSKWILTHCRSGKPNTPMFERVAKEILAAYKNEGAAVKRKQDLHRQIIASRAYIHLRWS